MVMASKWFDTQFDSCQHQRGYKAKAKENSNIIRQTSTKSGICIGYTMAARGLLVVHECATSRPQANASVCMMTSGGKGSDQ